MREIKENFRDIRISSDAWRARAQRERGREVKVSTGLTQTQGLNEREGERESRILREIIFL